MRGCAALRVEQTRAATACSGWPDRQAQGACGRSVRAYGARSQAAPYCCSSWIPRRWADARARRVRAGPFQSAPTNAHNRSRVAHRAGPAARILSPSPDATDGANPAPRGGRRGLLVLTAGPVRYFYGRCPTGPVAASQSDDRAGGSAPHPFARTQQRDGEAEDHDAQDTRPSRARARRPSARVAAALVRDRCPTPSEHPASERHQDQSGPGQSERSPRRVPLASSRLGEHADAAFEVSGVQDAPAEHGKPSRSDWGSMPPSGGRCWSQSVT
jgi:hypothetical protein